MAHLRHPEVPQISPSQRQKLLPRDVMLRKGVAVLTQLEVLQPGLDFLDAPALGLRRRAARALGHAAAAAQPPPRAALLWDLGLG